MNHDTLYSSVNTSDEEEGGHDSEGTDASGSTGLSSGTVDNVQEEIYEEAYAGLVHRADLHEDPFDSDELFTHEPKDELSKESETRDRNISRNSKPKLLPSKQVLVKFIVQLKPQIEPLINEYLPMHTIVNQAQLPSHKNIIQRLSKLKHATHQQLLKPQNNKILAQFNVDLNDHFLVYLLYFINQELMHYYRVLGNDGLMQEELTQDERKTLSAAQEIVPHCSPYIAPSVTETMTHHLLEMIKQPSLPWEHPHGRAPLNKEDEVLRPDLSLDAQSENAPNVGQHHRPKLKLRQSPGVAQQDK